MGVQTQVTAYLLPQDAAEARSAALGLLQAPEEVWVITALDGVDAYVPTLLSRGDTFPRTHLFVTGTPSAETKASLEQLVTARRAEVVIGTDVPVGTWGIATRGGSAFLGDLTSGVAMLASHSDLANQLINHYIELGTAAWKDAKDAQIMESPAPELTTADATSTPVHHDPETGALVDGPAVAPAETPAPVPPTEPTAPPPDDGDQSFLSHIDTEIEEHFHPTPAPAAAATPPAPAPDAAPAETPPAATPAAQDPATPNAPTGAVPPAPALPEKPAGAP